MIALVTVRLKDATGIGQMAQDMLFLPIRCEPIGGPWWRGPCPRALIPHIGPDPALLYSLAEALIAQRPIQHTDWRIVRMQQIRAHDVRLDPFDQRLEGFHGASTPADKRAFVDEEDQK